MKTETKFKEVNKEFFDKFIKEYPKGLEVDVAYMFEPPIKTWNDFTIADKWPDSVVAYCKLVDDSEYYSKTKPKYCVLINLLNKANE